MPAETLRMWQSSKRGECCAIVSAVLFLAMMIGEAEPCRGQSRSSVVRNNVAPSPWMRSRQPPHPIYYPQSSEVSIEEEGAADADEASPDAVLRRFMHLHSTMRYDEAVAVARRLVTIRPESSLAHYNLACALARVHRTEESLNALERAISAGWRRLTHLELDPDLQSIRWHTRYDELVTSLQNRLAAEQPVALPLRTDPWEAIARELSESLPAMLDRHEVPGVVIALLRDGRVVWEEAFGERCAERAAPMPIKARFPVQAPAQLVGLAAVVQCDALAAQHLAALSELHRDRGLTFAGAHPATMRHTGQPGGRRSRVAAHSPSSRTSMDAVEAPRTPVPRPGATGVKRRALEPGDVPTQRRTDRGAGASQLIVELATGLPFEVYCQETMFEPLGMTMTSFHADRDADETAFAVGHSALGTAWPTATESGGASLYTTAGDLASLLEGDIGFGSSAATPESRTAFGHSRRTTTSLMHLIRRYGGSSLRCRPTPDGVRIEIEEQVEGHGCLIHWYPHRGHGVVVLYNSMQGEALARIIANRALGGRP